MNRLTIAEPPIAKIGSFQPVLPNGRTGIGAAACCTGEGEPAPSTAPAPREHGRSRSSQDARLQEPPTVQAPLQSASGGL